MKKKLLLLFLISSGCFAQFKLKHKDIIDKYHPKEIGIKDGYRVYTQTLKDSLTIQYIFTITDSSLVTMVMDKKSGFSKKDIEDFQNEYLNDFSPTRTKDARKTESVFISYDEERSMMMFSVFSDIDPKKTICVAVTIDKKMIKEIVTLMNQGY